MRLVATVVLAVVLPACGLARAQDLSFRIDRRLHFTAPPARATVTLPFTVSWTIRGFRVAVQGAEPPSDATGYFGVFVDRAPIRPGHTMRAVAAGDPSCLRAPGCPDAAYLAQHHAYTTTVPSLTVTELGSLTSTNEHVELHTVTVVLMDTAGRRVGESAWQLDVRLRRPGGR